MTDLDTATPAELNRAVAEMRGWTPLFHGKADPAHDVWHCSKGGNKWHGRDMGQMRRGIPDWAGDLNEAVKLAAELDECSLYWTSTGWRLRYWQGGWHDEPAKEAATAITKAWIRAKSST